MKPDRYLHLATIITIVFIVLIGTIGFFLQPNVNYQNAINGTMLFYGDTHSLNFDVIPTVVNGISAVTSIVIGFSGAIIGLVYREDFFKDRKMKGGLLVLAFYSVIPLGILLVAYSSIIYGALDFSLRYALYALILALNVFIIAMLSIFYRLNKESNSDSQKKESGSPTSNRKKQVNVDLNKKQGDNNQELKVDDDRKKALKRFYKDLHYENWQRGQVIWVVNSILITGSLLVAFQSGYTILSSVVAIVLVIIANILYLTTDIETMVSYKKMSKIRPYLALGEVDEFAEKEIVKTVWYPFRKSAAYILFATLASAYSFLLSPDIFILVIVFSIVLLFNLIVVYYYLKIYELKQA